MTHLFLIDSFNYVFHFRLQQFDHLFRYISIERYDDSNNQQYKQFDHHQCICIEDRRVDLIDFLHYFRQ